MSHTEDKSAKQWLKDSLLSNALPGIFLKGKSVISVNRDDAIAKAFKLMVEHKIHSVAVFDPTSKKYRAFLDILDILYHAMNTFHLAELERSFSMISVHDHFSKHTCGELANISERSSYLQVNDNVSLWDILEFFVVADAVQRVAVVTQKEEIVGVCSRLRLVQFFSPHILKFSLARKSIHELNLGIKKVITVKANSAVSDAFKLIRDHGLNSVGVVHEDNGQLIGNISASDLKVVGLTGELFGRMLLSCRQYLTLIPTNPNFTYPISVNPSTTVEELIKKFDIAHVHRIYVVDNQQMPVGIVSVYDLLKALKEDVENLE
jgi:CBS domain-containing protein